jgi:hypothetical protein
MPTYFECQGKTIQQYSSVAILPREGEYVTINKRLYRVRHLVHNYDANRITVVVEPRS